MIHVLACSACNGDPNSPMTAGTFWGILVLLGMIGGVLGGFGGLFLFWMRRAKALERALAARGTAPAETDEPSVDEVPAWRTEEPAATDAPPSVH